MKNLSLNPDTFRQLSSLAKKPPHATIILGENGSDFDQAIKIIAKMSITPPFVISPEKNGVIDEQNGSIGVEAIRNLYELTGSKSQTARFFVFYGAEKMTHQAQNALLKLLEEPGESVKFVLVCRSAANLLPTIRSRAQKIKLAKTTLAQSTDLIESLGIEDDTKTKQILFIARGLPLEITKLAQNNDYFSIRLGTMQLAKDLVQAKPYEKLIKISEVKDDRGLALLLLDDVCRILETLATQNASEDVLKRIDFATTARDEIEANANIRLALMRAFI